MWRVSYYGTVFPTSLRSILITPYKRHLGNGTGMSKSHNTCSTHANNLLQATSCFSVFLPKKKPSGRTTFTDLQQNPESKNMKKRTKITLRTKIYLTIAGLLALTGALYAATPIFFTAFPQATGVAVSPINLYATGWCNQNFYGLDCIGNRTVLGMIPLGNEPCIEKYLAIAPRQSIAAGFTPTRCFHHRRPEHL